MSKADIDRVRKTPAYPFVEAAHYLNMPVSTLRSWCIGQDYADRDGRPKRFKEVIDLDGSQRDGLSFFNLVEAHVLAAIRREHNIPLPKVRDAVEYLRSEMGTPRPLLDREFQTNGISLFVEELGTLINVTDAGQVEMREMLLAHLRRIERDHAGLPIKLFPFTRSNTSSKAFVTIDPLVSFGRPVLRDRAVPTAVLADRFKAGEGISELAADFEVSRDVIEDAIRCELERTAA
jgi:uncharacterized protein (DUF433 family)